MRPARVEVEVEELVLHGFPPLDRDAVQAAVERHLASVLREGRHTDDDSPIPLSPGAIEESLGRGIADTISQRVGR